MARKIWSGHGLRFLEPFDDPLLMRNSLYVDLGSHGTGSYRIKSAIMARRGTERAQLGKPKGAKIPRKNAMIAHKAITYA